MLRVKSFYTTVSNYTSGGLEVLDERINQFLDANPNIEVKDIKYSSHAETAESIFSARSYYSALLMYEVDG